MNVTFIPKLFLPLPKIFSFGTFTETELKTANRSIINAVHIGITLMLSAAFKAIELSLALRPVEKLNIMVSFLISLSLK